jgi:cellulose synthase/poly-beta-1,6-N-acetylglucosamine synthase-like glycosyltransferase
MILNQSIFWVCLLLVAYTYFLYPVVLFFAYALTQFRRDWEYLRRRRSRRVPRVDDDESPSISMIIPSCNEEAALPGKLLNLLEMDYPPEKQEVIFVSDGSVDETNTILRRVQDKSVRTIFLPERGGKANALNIGVEQARHDILVFSDASTLFAGDALKALVRHFADPTVGVVCGALHFQANSESKQTEGFYWKYESMLRLMEARLGATLTASGAIYAIRKECYRPLSPRTLLDDFVVPMNARKLHYRVVYDPEALATDFAADSVEDEFLRRVRIATGSFRALRDLVHVPYSGFTGLAFFSHKLLRWIVPLLLIGVLTSNLFLLREPFYRVTFLAQLCFYLFAWVGYVFRHRAAAFRYALVGYFVVAMNLAFLVGFLRFVFGSKEVGWQPIHRA